MNRKFKSSEILSNLFYIGMGDFLSRALSLAAFIYLARVLGPDKLGLIGFGASAVALLVPVIDYGLGFVGTREVSRNPGAFKFYVKTIIFDRLLLATVSLVCVTAFAAAFMHDQQKIRMLLLYALTLIPGILTLTWAYQGIARTGWFLVEKNVQAVLYCAGIFAFVHFDTDVERVPIAYLVSALLPGALILFYFLKKQPTSVERFSVRRCLQLLRSSFRLFIPTLLSQLNLSIGLLLVVYFSSLQEAGYFSAASKVIVLSVAIPNLLWSSFYPAIARVSSDKALVSSFGATLYKYAVIIGIIPLFLGLAYGREIVSLIYGASYAGAVVPLQLFAVVASFQFVSIVFTRILPAFGMEAAFSRILMWGTGIQVAASLALVPHFGASGAACAYIVSEGIIAIAALRIFRRTIEIDLVRHPAAALITLCLCYAVVVAIRTALPIPVVPALLVILASYFGILYATSVISIDDFFPPRTPPN